LVLERVDPGRPAEEHRKTINPKEALIAKERYKAAVANRDLFVHGADWEYDMISVPANESQFLETMNYGVADVCRFLGVPGDMIDAAGRSRPSPTRTSRSATCSC
jgi:phage portal protein BeeE